jgi:ankyrin repeat protein
MPRSISERRQNSLLRLAYFAPALGVFAASTLIRFPLTLTLLLLANALTMLAVCHAAGYLRGTFMAGRNNRLLEYCVLFIAYSALTALLIGYPLGWLLRTGTLAAALVLSGAVVVTLILPWRFWPAFGALFVWKKACSPRTSLSQTLHDTFSRSRAITDGNDLYFSHGLPVTLSALVIAQGSLVIAGTYGVLPETWRLPALALYAIVLAPLAHWLLAARCAHAMLVDDCRARRAAPVAEISPPRAEQSPVDHGPLLHEPDINAMLLRCIRAGQTDLALAALEHGADPNTTPQSDDRDQRPPLVLATVSPDLRLLRGLIVKGADLNRNDGGLTPLLAATRDSLEGRPDAVMTLLTNGADPRCADASGCTPLHFAALSARPIVAALLCDADAPLNAVSRDGLTPLGMACAAANWELVRFLLDRGARVEVEHAQPALLAAASVEEDDPQGVKLLLKRKAHVNAPGRLARTALMTAALRGHVLICKALLDAGANIDLVDTHGTTALMEAARGGAIDVLELFADHSPALDACDSHGRTALIIASQSKQACEETVRQLLLMGACATIAAADGRCAVDYAAAAGRWNIVARLNPDYPVPASLVSAAAPVDDTAHLLDALRFGHWHIVETYAQRLRGMPANTLAAMFLELVENADSEPRQWLLRHGLDANSRLDDGTLLIARTLSALPASLSAARELMNSGAQVAGTAALAQVCAALLSSDNPGVRTALEQLAVQLVQCGAECLATDETGRTALATAIEAGAPVLTGALIGCGADVNARDKQGCTPLFYALCLAEERALDIVRQLIAAGADPEIAAANGETPLGIALVRRCTQLHNWLNWPLWKLPQRALRPADFVSAAASGDLGAVEKLLELGLPVDGVDAQGATALLRAAGSGHAELVALLIARGADPARSAVTGACALSAAVSARRPAVVEALLQHRANVDHRLPGGGTCLMIAAALGYPEIVALLLTNGAHVDAEDERGVRALHVAAQFAFSSQDPERAQRTLQLLLEHGAAVNAANAAGQTPLMLLLGARADPGTAVDQRQLLALLPLLLSRHPDLNAQDQRGVSALHACAMHGLLLAARALLAAGADPDRRDILDRTPRQIAHLLGFIDVAAELGASGVAIPGVAQTLRQPARGYDPA